MTTITHRTILRLSPPPSPATLLLPSSSPPYRHRLHSNLKECIEAAELISMGFEISEARKAFKEVGPSLNNAIDFILNGCKQVSSIINWEGCGGDFTLDKLDA